MPGSAPSMPRPLLRFAPLRSAPHLSRVFILLGVLGSLVSCSALDPAADPPEWALAIHGGAGVSPGLENADEYAAALERALREGESILAGGGSSLDAVTAVVVLLENDPRFNAGRGAVLTNEGRCELDASIMDGATLNCGAVASVTTVKNPILLARAVMTESRHVFLAGGGAEQFAREQGFTPVENDEFKTERRLRSLERAKERERRAKADQSAIDLREPVYLGTVGAVALDQEGNLAAATSTGGLTNKRYGRVGDSPIIGAGTFASNDSCAVSCTGQGELYIRHGISHSLAALVEHAGLTLADAGDRLIHEVLPEDSGGLIAIDREGNITMPFNTAGMHRGAANSRGLFEVSIFEDPVSSVADAP